MSSFTGLFSQSSGGGIAPNQYTLETFPVVPVQYGAVYQGISGASNGNYRDSGPVFWYNLDVGLVSTPNGFISQINSAGTQTILNETGSGTLYWVLGTTNEAGIASMTINIDGVEKTWQFNSTTATNYRFFGGKSLGNYLSGNSNYYVENNLTQYGGPSTKLNSDFNLINGVALTVGFNGSGYKVIGAPGLRYESSITISITTNVSWGGGVPAYAGGIRVKDA